MQARFTSLLLALLLVGCGDAMSADGGGLDAASGADAGSVDGGSVDAGGPTDAGAPVDAGGSSDAGVDCSTAVLDEACSAEGAYCGGPCTDPCSFCNILACSGGTWNRLEVFPAPCFECGESLRCLTGEQHCVHSFSDVGGVPDTFECADNPAACMGAMATCACLEETLTFDTCVEPNPGEVEIRYLGG